MDASYVFKSGCSHRMQGATKLNSKVHTKETMLDLFEKEMSRTLKSANPTIINHLAHHMIDSHYSQLSIKDALHHLFAAGSKNTEILAALVRCEWTALKEALPQLNSLDEKQQAQQLRGMIERFNAVKHALIAVSDELWHEKVIHKHDPRVLLKTREAWSINPQISLYNLFDEMPVRASIKVSAWNKRDHILFTKVTPELGRVFSADSEMRYAYIDSPITGFRLKLMLDKVSGENVRLKVVTVDASEVGLRKEIRVALEEPQSVKILSGTKLICNAELTEISQRGLGLVACQELPFIAGEKFTCQTQIEGIKIDHISEVVWVQSFLEGGRFALTIEFDKTTSRQLNSEILNLQRKKIERLSRLGMPPAFHR